MLLDAPPARLVAEVGEHETCGPSNVPFGLLSAVQTPASPKPDDVRPSVAGQVGEQARMLLDSPEPGVFQSVRWSMSPR